MIRMTAGRKAMGKSGSSLGSLTRRRTALRRAAGVVAEHLEQRVLLSTYYADASVAAATPDGTSWGTAYADLQAALSASKSGDTIRVAAGTYKPTSGTDRTISFQLKTGVEIDGGYAGDANADPNTRDIALYPTILSGDIGNIGDNSDNSYHVLLGSGTDATAILDGFTITGGNANGSSPNNSGAGLRNSSGSPTLLNCSFSNNSAGYGSGICNFSSSPSLTNCSFSNNSAGSGGGMYNFSSLALPHQLLLFCQLRLLLRWWNLHPLRQPHLHQLLLFRQLRLLLRRRNV